MRLACVLLFVCLPSAAHAQLCTDAALTSAAAELISRAERPDGGALTEEARRAGSDAPRLLAHARRDGDVEARRRFLERARADLGDATVCGEARSEGRAFLIVGSAAGHLEMLGEGRVRVSLEAGWREARLEVRDHAGTTWRHPVRRGDEVSLPTDLEAPLTVQLVAVGEEGPRPVAERWVGPVRLGVTVDEDAPVETQLADLRRWAEVGAARPNRLLARVATRHAELSCREARVGHLAAEGDPETRLAREGIAARHVGETVARATSPVAAYAAMLRSPSHRAALTDRRFTDIGVGTSEDESGRACLVVLLAAWPRAVPWRGPAASR